MALFTKNISKVIIFILFIITNLYINNSAISDYDYDSLSDYEGQQITKNNYNDLESTDRNKDLDNYLIYLKNKETEINSNLNNNNKDIDYKIYNQINNEEITNDIELGLMEMNNYRKKNSLISNSIDNISKYNNNQRMDYNFNKYHVNNYNKNLNNNNNNNSFNNKSNHDTKKNIFSYFYELMALLLIIGLVHRCIYGKDNYDEFVLKWYENNKHLFKEKFNKQMYYFYATNYNENNYKELKSLNKLYDTRNQIKLNEDLDINDLNSENIIKEGEYPIKKEGLMSYSCTFQDNNIMSNLNINIDIRKNTDLFYMATSLLFNKKDLLHYEVLLNDELNVNSICPGIFVICDKKQAQYIIETNSTIQLLCGYKKYLNTLDKVCLAENNELVDNLLDNDNIIKKLYMLKDVINIIYFTEDKDKARKLIIIYEANINTVNKQIYLFEELNNLCFDISEFIFNYSPSEEVFNKSCKLRLEYSNNADNTNTTINKEEVNTIKEDNSKLLKQLDDSKNNNKSSISNSKTNKKLNKLNSKNNNKRMNIIDQGMYAFTNSSCKNGFIPKTIFFK